MGGSNDSVHSNQVLDFTPPDNVATEHMRSLSSDNGLASLRLGDMKNIGSSRDADTKSGSGDVLDLSKPIETAQASDGAAATSDKAHTSIDLKFDEYNLPDGGKLLVGKSDYRDVPFQPVILDKNGQFVKNTGGGGGGGSGPNGEKLPESRGNSYSNGASDRYTEGDDKYHYTDSNGKEHTIQLKDKISFKEAEEPPVEVPEKAIRTK